MARKCGVCGKKGHNARTCPRNKKVELEPINVQPVISFSDAQAKKKEQAHKILKEQNQKVERQEIDGLIPVAGLWIVNIKRKRIAGKITQVKRNGEVTYHTALGASVSTAQERLKEAGYSYIQDLEPEMLRWRVSI